MDKQQIIEALRLIIARSESASVQAARAVQAVNANSPVLQQRLNFVAGIALADRQADFTQKERELIAGMMGLESDSEVTGVSFKLTKAERAEVERLAQGEGYKDLTSFIRAKIGLIN